MLSPDAQQELGAGRASRDVLGAEFEALLERVNGALEDHEKLGFLVVVGEQWSTDNGFLRSEEHTSELQSLMRISYAVFCLKKKTNINYRQEDRQLVKITVRNKRKVNTTR